LRSEQLEPAAVLAGGYGAAVAAAVAVIADVTRQLAALEAQLARSLEQHPDAEIIRGQPGLGVIVGARVRGEFGDDPNR
jgi:transposase